MVLDAPKIMTGTEFEQWVDERNNSDVIFELPLKEIFVTKSD